MNRSRTIAASVATAAALLLAACGTETLDNASLEDELRTQLSEDAGVNPDDVTVECPEEIEVEEGREFECELTAPNGDAVVVEVTLTNDEGGFEAVVPPQQFSDQ